MAEIAPEIIREWFTPDKSGKTRLATVVFQKLRRSWAACEDSAQSAAGEYLALEKAPENPVGWLLAKAFREIGRGSQRAIGTSGGRQVLELTKTPDFDQYVEADDHLGGLPAQDRRIVEMRLSGATWADVSAAENLPTSTVHEKFWRAISLIKEKK